MRVLIVEDAKEQRMLYRLALERIGAECAEAANGPDALSLDWTAYDVVLCDILMPGMAGDEVIRQAAEKWGVSMPPVVVFTALDHRLFERLALHLPSHVEIYQKVGSRDSVLSTVRKAVADAASDHSA